LPLYVMATYRTTLFVLGGCPHNGSKCGVGLRVGVLWELPAPGCPYVTNISGTGSFGRKFFIEFTFFTDQINK